MTESNIVPRIVTDAANDVGRIGDSLEQAYSSALPPTTAITPAAADEVSAAIAGLFNTHGTQWQALANQAASFNQQFSALLARTAITYHQADTAAQDALRGMVTRAEIQTAARFDLWSAFGPVQTGTPQPPPVGLNPVSLIVGGTDYALVSPTLSSQIATRYGLTNPVSVFTPEQFWPLTPTLGSLSLDQSVAAGIQDLNNAIMPQLALGHNVTIWGTSQGATVQTGEIVNLMASGSPGTGQLKFILTGNPNNPDGGAFERFTGLYVPGLDMLFNGATPPNSPYQTVIYSNQYDLAADFPRYPLNLVSDANTFMGFLYGQHDYVPWFPDQYVPLPTSPGYSGNTTYYMSLTQNLPLLDPLRVYLPAPYGNALADLLQPDVRVIVDMGYGSGEYANLPTPASLIEFPDPFTIVPDLVTGTAQGLQAFGVDMGVLPSSYYPTGYPFTPVLDPGLNFPQPQTPVTGLSLLLGAENTVTQWIWGNGT
jgi:hypothetical protein